MSDNNDSYYLQSVTHMGDRQKVLNHRDITSDSGLKLIAAGTRITSALYEKLVKHKLLPSLELCLTVEDSVDHAALIALIDKEIERDNSPFQPVAGELPAEWRNKIIEQIPLPPAMAFKLTVAREEREDLFIHSILLTALTLYLCRRIGWSDEETVMAATSALLHDIGILHINPGLFESGRPMSLEERRNLYAHPIISHMIITQFDDYPAEVSDAVLQHHERLDGSGYPRGLSGEAIGRIGQLLGVAELLASRFGGGESCSECAQLDLILKLNAQRLNAEYALLLKPFYKDLESGSNKGYSLEQCRDQILALSTLFADWHKLSSIHQPMDKDEKEQLELIDREIRQLKKNLLQTGLVFDEAPQGEADTSWLSDDPEHLAEITFLLKEAGWQLGDLYYNLHRRWPRLNPSGALHNWVERLQKVYGP